MNTVIDELARKAGYKHPDAVGQVEDYAYFDHTKFAELLVAECIEVCRRGKFDRKDVLETIHFDGGVRYCMNAIDDHFGD